MVRYIYTTIFSLIGLGAILYSCEEPLDPGYFPPVENKLVVVSKFSTGKAIEVSVSKNRPIGSYEPIEYVTDAKVELYWKETFLEQLQLIPAKDEYQFPYYISQANFPVSGVEYTIKVTADGYQPVMAKSRIPPSVKITKFKIDRRTVESIPGSGLQRNFFYTTIDFDDPSEKGDYYHLNISQQVNDYIVEGLDTLIGKKTLHSVNFNPLGNKNTITANVEGGLLFEDKPDDQELQIVFYIDTDPGLQIFGKTYLELRTISDDYYLYFTSLSKSDGVNPDPLSPPVIVYQNIENGLGIFAGYSNVMDSIQLSN
ncbi:MAG: DUF4249 domain-containing protein [Saprospiraceae bacterium]|nr:DUF4249 domain-containing protein [Lewinella sp.]